MCYSVESSIKTTALSLFAIIYLFQSGNPYFKWLAVGLLGYCTMQFSECLLWMTEPQYECTEWNVIISLTLIPLAIVLQPLGTLFGSFFVTPWSESSPGRQWFTIIFTAIIIASVAYMQLYKPEKVCTVVTPKGHLFWGKTKEINHNSPPYVLSQIIWFILVIAPLFMFWDKSLLLPVIICITPLLGFLYGHYNTDSRGSIWCFYTSFTSVVASVFLFLKTHKIFNAL